MDIILSFGSNNKVRDNSVPGSTELLEAVGTGAATDIDTVEVHWEIGDVKIDLIDF